MIHYAHLLMDLKVPPGDRLEALSGNLKGFHSIWLNAQKAVDLHKASKKIKKLPKPYRRAA